MSALFTTLFATPTDHTDEDTKPTHTDPFWQATPRVLHKELAMPVFQKSSQAPRVPLRQSRQTSATAAVRRAQCTHMTVNRAHGHLTCFICGKTPSIGWLYVCQQDRDSNHGESHHGIDPDILPIVPNDSTHFEAQACLAENLGMHAWVVNGIQNRDYNLDQVDQLIEQKKHLLATVRLHEQQVNSSNMRSMANEVRKDLPTERTIASVGASAGHRAGVQSSPDLFKRQLRSQKTQGCNFQVCHTCRPFFVDRLHTSFEKVLSGESPAVTEEEISCLPFLRPNIVRTLGLRYPVFPAQPSPKRQASVDITAQQADGTDEDTSDWTPTSATISESGSESIEGIDPYPCPGAGHCPVWSRRSGCAYDTGFDDGLRASNHGFGPGPASDNTRVTPENSASRLHRLHVSVTDTPGGTSSTVSSISLPVTPTAPLTPLIHIERPFEDELEMRSLRPGKAASIYGPLMDYTANHGRLGLGIHNRDSSSSLGGAVEVEGGVALTEEAVETGMPDIITADD
ncbi:hypothetical protein BAUCODRAFT_408497 [Baudoinia panamericana UAMH 10762]|uniref:Uncharacterized protein n=1 Tax=Baudoinia panamericana (strain UAMH 10762) TaxID=717646 RepID=M2N1Y2_BAUPA|nr:uncharacterized protein BAUCODRAFT_408497 [Baudoinia panamericana UAMH 10762]EMC97938.1 hypothetical protein BAUCODRAFT_408497 [Baudoinia panamericana UAMH 10762]